ncbi:MAG: spermidine synthase [Thermoanaerobaculia bacterium]
MQPFTLLDSILTPEGRRLSLHRRGEDFFLQLDGEELMSSREPGSECELARLGCRALPRPEAPRVLIGGLGFGYTLRATLALLPPRARVVVAEIFPSVVAWNRERLPAFFSDTLRDPRVEIRVADLHSVLGEAEAYDALLLDVDNGPSAWCLEANGRLYQGAGLERLAAALVPCGTLAVWSAYPDPVFVKRLGKAGFAAAKAHSLRSRGERGRRHTVFVAEKPRAPLGHRLRPG